VINWEIGIDIYPLPYVKSITRDFPRGPVVKIPTSNAVNMGLIPDQGIKIPHAAWCGQKQKR